MTNPTVGDVIGGRRTIIEDYPVLAASPANTIITIGKRYDKLPKLLQQEVTYSFIQNLSGQLNTSTTFAWPTVNNEKVTLSFKPATSDDEAALQSLLPEGVNTDFGQLPSNIPGYLINVVPELKVNGVTKLFGSTMDLGAELNFNTVIKHPGRSSEINYTYKIPAGAYVSVNTVAGNVSDKKFDELQDKINSAKTILKNGIPALISDLTKEDIFGDMFHAGTLLYFNRLLNLNEFIAKSNQTNYYLSAGYGIYGYEPKVNYIFGLPTEIRDGSVSLDIPINVVTANIYGDREKEIQFKFNSGVIGSALEHSTPEIMFNNNISYSLNAVSAVKILQKASEQGQRLYKITNINKNNIFPLLNLDVRTKNEIQAAINSNKEVITHTDNVNNSNYSGVGYLILDPVTGDGSYKISNGSNGGDQPNPRIAVDGTGVFVEVDVTECLDEDETISYIEIVAIAVLIAILIAVAVTFPISAAAIFSIYASTATADEGPCDDNCTIRQIRTSEKFPDSVPLGCIWCAYQCKNTVPPNTFIHRYNFVTEGCPSPIAFVPGTLTPTLCATQ